MVSKSRLRVGIIGCGNVAAHDHTPALGQIESVVPVAVADPVVTRRRQVLSLLDLSPEAGFDSHQAMLDAHPLDYVVVAVPPSFRQEIIADCARHGVHALCEKPVATHPVQAHHFQSTMAAAGLKLGLVHNYLYYPEYVLLRQLIVESTIGDLRHFTLNFLGVPDNPGARDYRPRWRHDPAAAGGGVLMDMIHALYLAEFLMGKQIQAVSAVIDNLGNANGQVEDLALLNLYFQNSYATINMGWGKGPGGVEVTGSDGRILVFYQDYGTGPFSELESFTLVNGNGRQTFHPRQNNTVNDFVAIHQDFVAAIQEDREPVATAENGRRALEAALAAYTSAWQGQIISLPLPQDHPVYLHGVTGLHRLTPRIDSPLVKRGLFGLEKRRS